MKKNKKCSVLCAEGESSRIRWHWGQVIVKAKQSTDTLNHLIIELHSFPNAKQDINITVGNADTKQEKSIKLSMKVVYFLAVESIPLSKYSRSLALLEQLDNPHLDALKVGENIN